MPGYNYVNKSSLDERVRRARLAKEGKPKKGLRAVNNEAVNEVDIQYQAFLSWLKDTYKGPKTPICTKELLEKQRKSKSDGKNKKKTKKKGSGHIHSHERSNDNSTVVEQVAEEEMATDESEEQEQSRAGNIIEEAGWRAGVAGFGS